MANCRSCEMEIEWVKTKNGKNMPVDIEPVKQADLNPGDVIVSSDGEVIRITPDTALSANKLYHYSHFASCPHANDWRK